jgi:hypothetical protein
MSIWRVFCMGERHAPRTIARPNPWSADDYRLASDDARSVCQRSPLARVSGCDESGGCHDLTLGKIYEMLGVEGKGAFYRIVDDSGEDYLYPVSHFKSCELD